MFTDNEQSDLRYHGYNPAFAKRARQRQQAELRAERAKREADRKEREKRALAHAAECAKNLKAIETRLAEERKREKIEARAEQLSMARKYETLDRMIAVRPPVRWLLSESARIHGCTVGDITGPRRNDWIVRIRHATIRLVADARPDLSLPHLGRIFNRDHSTVHYALEKTRKEGQGR